MSTFADIKMYGRFVLGLPGFLRRRITLDEARDAVRRGLEARDDNFLKVMRRGVFGNPRSPYLPLLRAAQCEYADIDSLIPFRLETNFNTVTVTEGVRYRF